MAVPKYGHVVLDIRRDYLTDAQEFCFINGVVDVNCPLSLDLQTYSQMML